MSGRYYVDDETSREIEKIVKKLDQRLKIEHGQDIHPSESAVILTKECREVAARQMQWGFPGFQGKGLLINARAEAILDKKTFRESVLHRKQRKIYFSKPKAGYHIIYGRVLSNL